MKPIAFPLLVCLLLAACGTTPASPSPTSPPTSVPTLTETPPPSPTETAVPTPTEDPLAQYVVEYGPIPPDGTATGVDTSRKQYMREVNGEKQYWSPEINDWTAPHVLDGTLHGGIPLLAQEQNLYNLPNTIPLYFDTQVGINAVYIRHPDDPSPYTGTDWEVKARTFTAVFQSHLIHRYSQDKYHTEATDEKTWSEFTSDLQNDKIIVHFETPWGKYDWKPSSKQGVRVILTSWDNPLWQQVDANDQIMHYETHDWYTKDKIFRWKTYTDAQGNLVTITAVRDDRREGLTDKQWCELLFAPVGQVLEHSEWTDKMNYWSFNIPQHLTRAAVKEYAPGIEPFLVIEPAPAVNATPTQ